MDIRHFHRKIEFTWNRAKAAANEAKHGVSFEEAAGAFFDPFFRVEDASGDSAESRQAILGLTEDWVFLYVVFGTAHDTSGAQAL